MCFHRDYALVLSRWTELTFTTAHALRHGKLIDLLVVDSEGKAVRVAGARKVRGLGRFGGYGIFLNQRIEVELVVAGEPSRMPLDQFKQRLSESFTEWHGWQATDEFPELQGAVARATTYGEIFDQLQDAHDGGTAANGFE